MFAETSIPATVLKIDLYCNSFKKYMDCMKSIEKPFLTTLLKSIISSIDICTILNEKENEGTEKQKADSLANNVIGRKYGQRK